jgi:hypothetical protein
VLLLVTSAPRVSAQTPGEQAAGEGYPAWVGVFTVLSANAVLGGLSAGVVRRMRGGSFEEAFVRGMLGGAVTYGGKRVAVEHFDGAGLIGRQIAAVGSSMSRNAADGHALLERVLLPVGPVHLYVEPGSEHPVRARVDLNALLVTGYGLNHGELRFDASRSLSAGAPVFLARERVLRTGRDTINADGTVIENVIVLSEIPWRDPSRGREVFGHERIHVLQRDHVFIMWSGPAMRRAMERIPGAPVVGRWVDLHPTDLVFSGLRVFFPEYERRPWEMEADLLMKR